MLKKTLSLLMSLSLIGGSMSPSFNAETPQNQQQQKIMTETAKKIKSKISQEEYKKLEEKFKELKEKHENLEKRKRTQDNNNSNLKFLSLYFYLTLFGGFVVTLLSQGYVPGRISSAVLFIVLDMIISA